SALQQGNGRARNGEPLRRRDDPQPARRARATRREPQGARAFGFLGDRRSQVRQGGAERVPSRPRSASFADDQRASSHDATYSFDSLRFDRTLRPGPREVSRPWVKFAVSSRLSAKITTSAPSKSAWGTGPSSTCPSPTPSSPSKRRAVWTAAFRFATTA